MQPFNSIFLIFLILNVFTGAVKIAILASTIWLLCAILIRFALPPHSAFIVIIIFAVLFFGVPAVNYTRMLFAIRRHNSQLGDIVPSQQISPVLRREKKVALDMWIITILLLVSLAPTFIADVIRSPYPRVHSILFPWAVTVAFMASSINPLFYFWRNKRLRNALKSMMNI